MRFMRFVYIILCDLLVTNSLFEIGWTDGERGGGVDLGSGSRYNERQDSLFLLTNNDGKHRTA